MTKRIIALLLLAALVATACSGDDGGESASDDTTIADILGDPGDCLVVDMTVSPEKIDLLTDLARDLQRADGAEVDGECVFVRPQSKASGLGAALLTEGWNELRRSSAGHLVPGLQRLGGDRRSAPHRGRRRGDRR